MLYIEGKTNHGSSLREIGVLGIQRLQGETGKDTIRDKHCSYDD